MGRPRKLDSQRKMHVMPVRFSETQHEIITRNAERAGMRVMDYIRHQAVHGKVNVEYRITADVGQLHDLTRELSAIGRNLNQIARYYNSGGLQSQAVTNDINMCISGIMEIRKAIMIMAGDFNGNPKAYNEQEQQLQ